MFNRHEGVSPLHDDPYNIGGAQAWQCIFESAECIEKILSTAFPNGSRQSSIGVFSPGQKPVTDHRAAVLWKMTQRDEVFLGDVLVDEDLNPIGFILEVYAGTMVFNLSGDHIPLPRFR